MREFASNFAPLMREYESYMKASGRYGGSTYPNSLRYFDSYCADKYPDDETLSQEMVDTWCARRESENNNSCITRTKVIVSFIVYLQKRSLTDICVPYRPRKEPQTYIPHAFTENELTNFFNACDSIPASPLKKRQMTPRLTIPVFFRLLYSSGLRTNEARLLRRSDVDLEHGILNIEYTKGLDQHFVVLHDSMLTLMREYDIAIDKFYPNRIYFFPSIMGGFYSRTWVEENFQRMWRESNNSYATAYELRHNYAVENINGWTDDGFEFNDKLLHLSKSMGHSTVEGTKYYYSLVPRLADVLASHVNEDETIPEVWNESDQ
jgi:integrase